MKILALESSATPASCAVTENGKVLASAVMNIGMTHSQTLLPMVQSMLSNAHLTMADIDVCAVSVGPGSFTGVRIGVAAVKGIAFADDKPCVAVSTLEAMATMFRNMPFSGVICCCMDARCAQVYTALFSCDSGKITRLTLDEALPVDTLRDRLIELAQPVMLVGDGIQVCRKAFVGQVYLCTTPDAMQFQQAVGVAFAAEGYVERDELCTPQELLPQYLRLPQAERELRARKGLT